MTKQVALSNAAYAALHKEKRENESFSDLCMRLLRESRVAKKDPMRFVNHPHKFWLSMEEHLKMVEEGRQADRERDPWEEEARRVARTKRAPPSPPHPSGDAPGAAEAP